MDKEGQNAHVPVFQSENIGNKATPEYFSNVKGGKKDQEKVERKRSRMSRKTLFTILGALAGAIIVIFVIALVANLLSRPKGSRTDEVMPTSQIEIEERAYKVLYSGDENGYENAIVYLNDLIKDMGDLNYDSELIFDAYSARAYIAYQAGGEDVAIDEALRLLKEADTVNKKYSIYSTLILIYTQEGNTDKRDFYRDMVSELDIEANTQAQGGGEEEYYGVDEETNEEESEGENE